VGTTLIIPQSVPEVTQAPEGVTGQDPGTEPLTPTPPPVEVGNMTCTRVEDGGVLCFQPVRNILPFTLEGLSAVFRLSDQQGHINLEQTAFLPLDTLPAGVSLPLTAYFPPNQAERLAPPYQFNSDVRSALPGADDGRYIPAQLENLQVLIAENGISASASANVIIEAKTAKRVWVAAVAYDAAGNVVGVRRWEKQDTRPLENGQKLAITLNIYSVSAPIARVALVAEVRP